MKCHCGVSDPYCAEAPTSEGCGGLGWVDCLCGGDRCVCHNHGRVDCPGCEDCEESAAMEKKLLTAAREGD